MGPSQPCSQERKPVSSSGSVSTACGVPSAAPIRYVSRQGKTRTGSKPAPQFLRQVAFLHCESNFTAGYTVSRLRSAISNQSKVVVNATKNPMLPDRVCLTPSPSLGQ